MNRPYRLWDAKAKAPLRWRCYKHHRNAHNGALIECRWAKIGVTIEVYNQETGRMLGQYTRHPTGVGYRSA
jgi:hypothetical protein